MDSITKLIKEYRWVLVVLGLVIIGGFLIGNTPENPVDKTPDGSATSTEAGQMKEIVTSSDISGEFPVTVDEALNGSYRLDFLVKNVKLENGSFEEKILDIRETEDSIVVTTSKSNVALGNITSDDNSDAAVILYSSTVNPGVFTELTVLTNNKGTIKQVSSVYLGDRVKIESLTIKDRIITVAMKTHAADDNLCCPTQDRIKRFALLEDDRLVPLQ
jgi:hypothetical protein